MPEDKDQGHEPAKDAFDMSDEDFQKELENAQVGPSEDDTVVSDTDKDGGDTDKIKDKPPEKDDQPPADKGKADKTPKPVETKPDVKKSDGDKPKEARPPDDASLVEITHNGVVYKVTPEKYKELAQKGYDYDAKIGPHGRLVSLITSTPQIAKMVNDYVVGDTVGDLKSDKKPVPQEPKKLKPLSEYESTEEWFKDNFAALTADKPKPEQRNVNPDPVVARDVQGVGKLLFNHDPANFKKVIPHLKEARENLTVKRSKEIERSYTEFEKFYDEVKAQVVTGDAGPPPDKPPTPPDPPVTPAFHVKPGGGTPARATDQSARVWDLSKKEFDAELAKAKGY